MDDTKPFKVTGKVTVSFRVYVEAPSPSEARLAVHEMDVPELLANAWDEEVEVEDVERD